MTISEIKKTAKTKLSGFYIKCASSSLLFFIVILVLSFIQKSITDTLENTALITIIKTLFLIINWILSYGIISNIIDLSDTKTNSITNFLNVAINNTTKYIKIALNIIIKILVPLIIFIFVSFYLIGTIISKINNISFLCFYPSLLPVAITVFFVTAIILIYFILDYILVAYIFHEHPNMSPKEITLKSKEIMNGKKLEYILLNLSFLNWYLIGFFILFILSKFIETSYLTSVFIFFYSLLRPYTVISKLQFYESLGE